MLAVTGFMAAVLACVTTGLFLWLFVLGDAVLQAKRHETTYTLRPYNRVIVYALYVVVLGLGTEVVNTVVRGQLVRAFRIPSSAMIPTLLPGDHMLADMRPSARRPERGDIAVHLFPPDPRKTYMKRVVALGGQTVEVRDKKLFVDGEEIVEPFVVHMDTVIRPGRYDCRDNCGPTTVPEHSYFVLGDNRDNSNDSRYWGPLPGRYVLGKVHGIYFSWDSEKKRIRWERIGKLVK